MRFQISKYLFVFFLLIFGLLLVPSIEPANAQTLGCCTNSGNNQCRTNTPCGPGAGATCQVTEDTCRNAPGNEGGNIANNWIEGETCLITGMQRQCGDNGTDCCYSSVVGCCELPDGSLMQETELQCAIDGGTYLNEGSCPATGCCQVADQCTDAVTQAECTSLQGIYGGDDVQCGTGLCVPPPATGCCQVGDMCTPDLTEDECAAQGGTYGGDDVPCGQGSCVAPTGCCQVADMCTDALTQTECTAQGGTYGGDDVPCGQGSCVAPTGCCQVGEMCSDTTQTECTEGQGIFGGVGVQCGTDPCVPPTGCCVVDNECREPVLQSDCSGTFDADTVCGEGLCVVDPIGCCVENDQCTNSVPQSECSGTFEQDGLCGQGLCDPEPVEPIGCCVQDNQCTDSVPLNQCDGIFDPNTPCGQGLCTVEPEGCCVCGESECSITTEAECSDMDCTYQGDDTVCDGIDECSDVPGCCFLDANGADAALANRQIDPNKCIETTATICNLDGGDFQGVGTSCLNDFPQECSFPTKDIPTMSQWGLIAMAGLLGIFSLMIIMRRQKYNLS